MSLNDSTVCHVFFAYVLTTVLPVLLRSIQDVIVGKFPANYFGSDSSSDSKDSEDEDVPVLLNSKNKRAEKKLSLFGSYKQKKLHPTMN